MKKKLNASQIRNFYKNVEELDEPIAGKIMVLSREDSDGQFNWVHCYKIVEVGKRSFKAVDKDGHEHWYMKDRRGYAEAFVRDGKLHFNCSILRYRDHIHPTYYNMAEGIDYTVYEPYSKKPVVRLHA